MVHLCLDFGTGYCKAASCSAGYPPSPLAIGQAVRQQHGDSYMIRTALHISPSGKLFFGEAAVDTADGEGRLPFDTIKETLTAAENTGELDEPLPEQHNPTEQRVSKRQAVALYLGYLTQAALRVPPSLKRDVLRSIAMPVFAEPKTKWVSTMLAESLRHAQVLADRFGDNEILNNRYN